MSEYDCPILGLVHGTQQSPIDIIRAQTFEASLPEIAFSYPDTISGSFKRHAWDDAHPFFAISDKICAEIKFGVTTARLKQIHFHSPSEHFIDSTERKAEFHFVHDITAPLKGDKDFHMREPSTKIVFGVFFDQSMCKELTKPEEKNKLEQYEKFATVLGAFRKRGSGERSEEVELPEDLISEVIAVSNEYFHYRGSLTTGAYAEIVTWLVFPNSVAVHGCLPNEIAEAEQHTRALQAINRRTVLHRKGLDIK